ncbi:peptidyl-prolyl cis-trans isomerase FKBP35-like [Schistocerca cancellata]|uniref:peptidyl-prolyl cis-trans isomerase FKBP35-like n=1 Tax=Schistocerca cancellata TaxID=274614 RepID=UPI0021187292|nr:peptidyl-prolyl cis-trans isomerase FKBP35-like [Schistocerca cancellata]XP_049776559.1 peptidyl-prolyl cis-trans isomerase FKBP35-like [Schistocerca cancellata]XP_049776560.1 peptidyl-prolyl cis-trans isomerase FKBP35-like [Schistocerca cancellata]XP_049776561.1 peptidyl-prolyl cis-trans isomerase FKBP35-like [Schistocerca cancellata]XP_049776562.1 peptidyl-prolyl cis-trans isomerase FKBP35-like [Schistocerca cancellata]XP_049776563.1 peptidyl-prolyl cis-trans isomerase FKBP35-like [Schist
MNRKGDITLNEETDKNTGVQEQVEEEKKTSEGQNVGEEDGMECQDEEGAHKKRSQRQEEDKLLNHLRHISKTIVKPGEWGTKPQDFAECKVKITDVSFEGVDVDPTSCYFSNSFNGIIKIGEADNDLDRLLELCVQCMFLRETSHFVIEVPTKPLCQSKYETRPSIKGNIKCILELEELHNDELLFDWSKEKKFSIATLYKEQGVKLFRAGRIIDSFIKFSKAFKIIVTIGSLESLSRKSPLDKDILSLRVNLLNNMASCQLHQKNFHYVIVLCQKVLKIDENNVKALYRNAVACKELHNYETAEDNLKAVLKIEPNNTAAKGRLQEVREVTKEMNDRYAAVVKKMFK